MARTSVPIATNDCATAVPNLPSPMTTTDVASRVLCFLANNWTLLREVEVTVTSLQCEGRSHGDGADSPDEHQHRQRQL